MTLYVFLTNYEWIWMQRRKEIHSNTLRILRVSSGYYSKTKKMAALASEAKEYFSMFLRGTRHRDATVLEIYMRGT
jgi:hypothetical protein